MWLAAVIAKPLVFMVLLYCFCHPGKRAVQKWMKDGKLKRLLLTRLN
jgi:hypothetical protein